MIAVLYYQDCHLQYIQNLFVLAIKANPNITQNVFIGLKNLLSDSNEVISRAAVHGIAEVVKVSPDIIHDVFITLKNLFIDSNENIRCTIADSIVEIVKAIPTQVSFKELKELFSYSNKYIKGIVVWSLINVV